MSVYQHIVPGNIYYIAAQQYPHRHGSIPDCIAPLGKGIENRQEYQRRQTYEIIRLYDWQQFYRLPHMVKKEISDTHNACQQDSDANIGNQSGSHSQPDVGMFFSGEKHSYQRSEPI